MSFFRQIAPICLLWTWLASLCLYSASACFGHVLRHAGDGQQVFVRVDVQMVVDGPVDGRLRVLQAPARHPVAVGVQLAVGARSDAPPAALQVRVGAHPPVDGRPVRVKRRVAPQALRVGVEVAPGVRELAARVARHVRQALDAARVRRVVHQRQRRPVLQLTEQGGRADLAPVGQRLVRRRLRHRNAERFAPVPLGTVLAVGRPVGAERPGGR